MLAALAAMLFALATVSSSQQAAVPADARATIAAANAGWLLAMKTGDATAIAAPYADGGIFVTATGAVVVGRDGIAKLMRERLAQVGRMTDGELVQDGVTRQGTSIYEWGHATMEFAREGSARVRSAGRYLTVWQKNAAGRWEITRNLSLPE